MWILKFCTPWNILLIFFQPFVNIKTTQYHSLSEKCKSKSQWGTISCQSEWLRSKSLWAINAGEGAEKREPSYTVGGSANEYRHYGEQCGVSLKNWKQLPYDPAIPLLGTHTEETRIERDMCTPMFIAALFIIARTWKLPRCPSADEWIKKLWYICTMEYYSAIKNAFASVLMRWMKLEPIIEWSKSERKTPIQCINAYI